MSEEDLVEQSFPYGASYSPLIFPESEWEKDLGRMTEASMNLVRVGDVHGSWDRIEPRQGEFELEILDRFYRVAADHGIRVLLSTGAACPPLWLKTTYPDVSIMSSRGERYPLGSSYHWACIHHPGYLDTLESYTVTLARFALKHPNHFGWQISNEIGFPFMPAREKNELGLYCYCEHCQGKFRDWLKNKYSTLADLTEAWSWSTTNFVYNDWVEAVGPESLPASWSGVTRWIDWRLFWQESFAKFGAWQHNSIRTVDSDHPTSINTFNFKGFDRFGTFMGLDQWKIAQEVDHIGYDLYPGSGDKLKTRPEHNSIFLDHGRSVARSVGRAFWLHEVESGPIGGWLMGPEHNTDGTDIENMIVESIGHDGKLIIYMPWREWRYQPIRWGALVDLNGNPTQRLKAASRIGKFLKDESKLLAQTSVPQGEIAILESKPNAIFLRGVDQEELLFQAQRGFYRAFWDRGYSVDFITPDQLSSPSLKNYQVVCLPLLGLLDDADAGLLENYVNSGGIVFATSRLATLDNNGWTHEEHPLPALGRIFGIKSIEADTLENQSVLIDGARFSGAINRDRIISSESSEELARFDDGGSAIVRANLGDGFGVYIGTQADIAYLDNPESNLLGYLIQKLLIDQPKVRIEGEFSRARGVDHHFLDTDEQSLIVLSNYLLESSTGKLIYKNDGRVPDSAVILYPEKNELNINDSGSELSIPFDIGAKEVVILKVLWK